jgi:hypothetical protein
VTIHASDESGAARPRIALFDWVGGGHHPIYARRFAEALSRRADVLVAAPNETATRLEDLPVETIGLGDPRPASASVPHLSRHGRAVFDQEIELFEQVIARGRPDHIVHLYADAVLPHLLRRRRFRTAVSVLVFTPRAHYPAAFQTPLTTGERLRAWAKDGVIALWRRRSDAHALLTLDQEAARRWAEGTGAAAYWVPEPPVSAPAPVEEHERSGCIVYGALGERKGIDLLTNAVALDNNSLHVTIAGEVNPDFLPLLEGYVSEMRRSGAVIDVRPHPHTEQEGLRALAASSCAVLPYPHHDGMSRLLLEAATVQTPVIVHDRGLLGHLVRRHCLGLAVDCRDATALRRAIHQLAEDPGSQAAHADNLALFASRFSAEIFDRALARVFAGDVEGRRVGRGRNTFRSGSHDGVDCRTRAAV